MTRATDQLSRRRAAHAVTAKTPSAACAWSTLIVVASPSILGAWALYMSCIDGTARMLGVNNEYIPAFATLMAFPPLVWLAGFLMTRRHVDRYVCAVLYATTLTLPVLFIALLIRVAMAAPII